MEYVLPAVVAFAVTSIIAIILFVILCVGKLGCKCYCCAERRRRENLLSTCTKSRFTKSICSNETCPVCLDDFGYREKLVITLCSHGFHEDCLLRCLKNSAHCPLCKVKVLKSESVPLLHST